MTGFKRHIFICLNERTADDPRGCCTARGSMKIQEAFSRLIKERGLKGSIRANKSGCLDHCAYGPSVVVYPEGIWYTVKTLDDVTEIMDHHIVGDKIVERLRMGEKP
jgi:(2Fe-2S) ferredoxin